MGPAGSGPEPAFEKTITLDTLGVCMPKDVRLPHSSICAWMSKWLRSLVYLPSRFVSPSLSVGRPAAASLVSNMSSNNDVKLSDAEWKQRLTPTQFQVLRLKGTERAGTGEYNKHKETGVYVCAGCKTPVYTSTTKFDSGCGWPAFYDAIPGAIKAVADADGHRTEIVCAKCDGHMGHVFKGEGFKTPTDERHCVNSVSLVFHAGEVSPQ